MSESRQLAAIVFSDISGFTHTMEGDEKNEYMKDENPMEHLHKYYYIHDIIEEYNRHIR